MQMILLHGKGTTYGMITMKSAYSQVIDEGDLYFKRIWDWKGPKRIRIYYGRQQKMGYLQIVTDMNKVCCKFFVQHLILMN